jgi:hypothetical protein
VFFREEKKKRDTRKEALRCRGGGERPKFGVAERRDEREEGRARTRRENEPKKSKNEPNRLRSSARTHTIFSFF